MPNDQRITAGFTLIWYSLATDHKSEVLCLLRGSNIQSTPKNVNAEKCI